jgi:hypothetical protein
MSQDFESLTLERWANFDFEAASTPPDSSTTEDAPPDSEELTTNEAMEEIPAPPPAYQDLEIEVGKVPLYKRPHIKGLFFGSGVLLICALLGTALTQGTNVKLGNSNPEAIAPEVSQVEDEDEVDPDQAKLSELEGEIAFSTLKNRAAVLEEQKKQQVLTGQLDEQQQESEVSASLPPINSTSPGRAIAPSRSYTPPPRQTFIPPTPTPIRSIPSAAVAPTAPQQTMVSFGALPENQGQSRVPTLRTPPDEAQEKSSVLLVQQETSFLRGDRQFLVEGGQSLTGTIMQQMIAAEKAILNIRTTEAILGLPADSQLLAEITQFTDGYLVAEVRAILQGDRPATLLPAGTMTISGLDGRLLKAKTDQSFLQTQVGRALLGAGRELADQYISRSETFFQNESSTSITRAGGDKDWTSLGSAALKGLADSLLAEPDSESAVQLVQPNTPVQLTIHQAFVVSPWGNLP